MPPFHASVSKRLIKTPKLHFIDSGLVCYLLGIRSPEQPRDHPLRGAVFETCVASEILKSRAQRGLASGLSFLRDRKGAEVDVVVEAGRAMLAVEAKSGQTVAGDFFAGLHTYASLVAAPRDRREVRGVVVYGGADAQRRTAGTVVPWSRLERCEWW